MRITSSTSLATPNTKRSVQATVKPRPIPITTFGQIGELECVGTDTGIAPSVARSRSIGIVIPLAPGDWDNRNCIEAATETAVTPVTIWKTNPSLRQLFQEHRGS